MKFLYIWTLYDVGFDTLLSSKSYEKLIFALLFITSWKSGFGSTFHKGGMDKFLYIIIASYNNAIVSIIITHVWLFSWLV